MLEVDRLVAGDGARPALHAVSLTVASAELVAVLGPPGAGKSTLGHALSAITPVHAGRIRFLGHDITGIDPVDVVRAGLIHVPQPGPQGAPVFPTLSVRDNLLLGATIRGRPQRTHMMAYVLQHFPSLSSHLSRKAGTLGVSDRAMLAIGRGLMSLPRLMLLDDPASGLPPDAATGLLLAIGRLNEQGLAILLAAPVPADPTIAVIANRQYAISAGMLTALDRPQELPPR